MVLTGNERKRKKDSVGRRKYHFIFTNIHIFTNIQIYEAFLGCTVGVILIFEVGKNNKILTMHII